MEWKNTHSILRCVLLLVTKQNKNTMSEDFLSIQHTSPINRGLGETASSDVKNQADMITSTLMRLQSGGNTATADDVLNVSAQALSLVTKVAGSSGTTMSKEEIRAFVKERLENSTKAVTYKRLIIGGTVALVAVAIGAVAFVMYRTKK